MKASKRALYFAAALLLTALLSSGATILVMRGTAGNSILMTTKEYDGYRELLVFRELMGKIDDEYYQQPPAHDAMIAGAAEGLVETLKDPYARYYTAEEYEAYLSNVNGEYQGIGVLIGQADDIGVRVLSVYEGNPAAHAGVLVGDVITHVNDAPTANLALEDVSAMINAANGGTAKLTLERAGGGTLTVEVPCTTVNIKRVQSALYNQKTGYIRIDMFTGNCAAEFHDALEDLTDRGMRSLVIDLRNNPGGSLDEVVSICEALLSKDQTIVSVGPLDGSDSRAYRAKGDGLRVPLAVIVNENSASASEILAAAVQDNGAGVIVGCATYGKGIVQTTLPVRANGGWLKLTTDAYFTPNGRNIHGVGVQPDIAADLPPELKNLDLASIDQAEDTQLWAALSAVRERADSGSYH